MNINVERLVEERVINAGDFLYMDSYRTLLQVIFTGVHDRFMVINLKTGSIDADNLTRDEVNKIYINYTLISNKNVEINIKY